MNETRTDQRGRQMGLRRKIPAMSPTEPMAGDHTAEHRDWDHGEVIKLPPVRAALRNRGLRQRMAKTSRAYDQTGFEAVGQGRTPLPTVCGQHKIGLRGSANVVLRGSRCLGHFAEAGIDAVNRIAAFDNPGNSHVRPCESRLRSCAQAQFGRRFG